MTKILISHKFKVDRFSRGTGEMALSTRYTYVTLCPIKYNKPL